MKNGRLPRHIVFLLVFFFFLRLGAAFFRGEPIREKEDSFGYNNYAQVILKDGNWLRSAEFIASQREPGYPLFLASTYALFGKENLWAVYTVQALLNVFMILFMYRLACKMFNSTVGLIVALWAGCYGFYLWYGAWVLREILVYFLFFATVYAFYACVTSSGKKKISLFLLSVAYTALIHTDSRYLYLIPCLFVLFFIYLKGRRAARCFFSFFFLVILLSVPWGIRNWYVYKGFVPISTMYFSPRRNAVSDFKMIQRAFSRAVSRRSEQSYYPSPEELRVISAGENPSGRSAQEVAALLRGQTPPATFWERKWFNVREMWRIVLLRGVYTPYPSAKFKTWSVRHNLMSIFSYGLLVPFVFFGFAKMICVKNKYVWLIVVPLLFHAFVHMMVWGEVRYRIPVDSLIIILGAYGVYALYGYLKKCVHERASDSLFNSREVVS